ncbi:hypothetical protein Suden_0973 [Sulfurimonas denitrificans DSM 1251]|uniref:STAS domain-containing protein n=1 Tax=Sulfurimonas denitrificans (strain ATCC 33889 / DSM 1251) TaxID=326298 RepID=Q30RY0_SULDN|nr:hypothetical protein [Sulfurimonas denitrificans]ABB44251.1 hypothetical protein Suden_0973 [Sulfurimonas denitrificans DSM 1251]MDD3443085.1 hypothetical protein [Sulfurimonas denitrificans]
MNLADGVLIIDAKSSNDSLNTLAKDILQNISEIKEVVVDDTLGVESSALFSLLVSIRKTAPHVKINFLDKPSIHVEGIGIVSLNIRG